jgi:hypothetical protein
MHHGGKATVAAHVREQNRLEHYSIRAGAVYFTGLPDQL